MSAAKLERGLTKVPELTLLFWVIKIAATTLGETGGDAVSIARRPWWPCFESVLSLSCSVSIYRSLYFRLPTESCEKVSLNPLDLKVVD